MNRGHWGSRLAFVLAAAGSAIGLGNIWKFPYITYVNGGGKFVILYLFCILLVGLPVILAEMILGRSTQMGPVGSVEHISGKKSGWRGMGMLGVFASFAMMTFYGVVAGWVLSYIVLSLIGRFNGMEASEFSTLFSSLASSPWLNVGGSTVFLGLSLAIVLGGVKSGLEKFCNVLMPLLIGIMVCLCINSMFSESEGFSKAIKFMFSMDGELKGHAILEALGHAFFSLSIGMGAMLTYGSYMSKDGDLVKSAVLVAFLDTLVALMACIIIFSTLLGHGVEVGQSVGLVFQTLPYEFAKASYGSLVNLSFFILLFLAALTSGISLVEVPAAYLIDKGYTRNAATLIVGGIIWIVSIPCALSGTPEWNAVFGGWSFFDTMDNMVSWYLLPLGGLLICLYVGFVMPDKMRKNEYFMGSSSAAIFYTIWLILVRFVAPLIIIVIMCNKLGFIEDKDFDRYFSTLLGSSNTVESVKP